MKQTRHNTLYRAGSLLLLLLIPSIGFAYWNFSTFVSNGDMFNAEKWNSVVAQLVAVSVNPDWNATTGYAKILNKPTIPVFVNPDWNAVSGPSQILNKPTIPAAQVNTDWNAVSGPASIVNKPTIPTLVNADRNATSGYAQILNKPWILNGNNQYTTIPGNVSIGNPSTVGKLTVYPSSPAPSGGIGSFGLVTSGSYGGGIGLQDGAGNFGVWTDTAGTAARFGFGTNLGALNSVFSILSSGNVGIGTTTPTQKLDVAGNIAFNGKSVIYGSVNDVYLESRVIRNTSSTTTDGMFINYGSSDSANNHIRFYGAGNAEVMRIQNNGFVGIGIPTAVIPLHVHVGAGLNVGLFNSTYPSIGSFNDSFSAWGDLGINNTIFLRSNGYVGIGTSAPESSLHIAGNILTNNAIIFHAKNSGGANEPWMRPRRTDNIMYTNFGANGWNIRNNSNSPVMFLTNAGNVGIGATAPGAKLEVVGTIKATRLNVSGGAHFKMNLAVCGGACAGYHALNTWTSGAGWTRSVAYNTDPSNFVKDGGGTVTIREAGVYKIRLQAMAIPTTDSGYLGGAVICPFINGGPNCLGAEGQEHRYCPGGRWCQGRREYTAALGAGTTVTRGYYPVQPLNNWCHDSYCSLEIIRIN